jgi:two-component system sensor histidine kinase UhpB
MEKISGKKSINSSGILRSLGNKGLRQFYHFSPVGYVTLDRKGNILAINPCAAELLGKKADLLLGHPLAEFICETARAGLSGSLERAFSDHSTVSLEATLCGRNLAEMDVRIDCLVPEKSRRCLVVITDITHRRQTEEKFNGLMQKLRALSAHIETGMEKERKRIAREIHDGLGSSLSGLKMELSVLRRSIGKDRETEKRIGAMSELIDSMVDLVRKLATELRPEVLDELGLVAAIRWFARDFSDRTGIGTGVNVFPRDFTVKPALSTAIFRIFQEIMTNISRHSRAGRVTIFLRKKNHQFQMRVRDDGIGIREEDLNSKRSFGIIGIQERVKLQKGIVKITGIRGKGTTIYIEIPITDP